MWRIQRVASTGSTNADVADAARDGAAEGLVLVADHQRAGRGRLGRVWESPPETSLAVSFLLRPDRVPPMRWPWLPLLAGVAFAEAIRGLSGTGGRPVDAVLKWPNDILVGGRKLAGILVERVETGLGPAAVVGVGLNVSQTVDQLPPGATSLGLVVGSVPDRELVLAALAERLAERYSSWRTVGGDPAAGLGTAYRALCDTLGREVRAELPAGDVLRGRAVDIDESGRLVVDAPVGPVAVSAGDVVHVRPA